MIGGLFILACGGFAFGVWAGTGFVDWVAALSGSVLVGFGAGLYQRKITEDLRRQAQ